VYSLKNRSIIVISMRGEAGEGTEPEERQESSRINVNSRAENLPFPLTLECEAVVSDVSLPTKGFQCKTDCRREVRNSLCITTAIVATAGGVRARGRTNTAAKVVGRQSGAKNEIPSAETPLAAGRVNKHTPPRLISFGRVGTFEPLLTLPSWERCRGKCARTS